MGANAFRSPPTIPRSVTSGQTQSSKNMSTKTAKKVWLAPRRYQTICAHLNIRYSTVPTYDAVRRRLLRASSPFLPFWPGSMNSPFFFLKKSPPFFCFMPVRVSSPRRNLESPFPLFPSFGLRCGLRGLRGLRARLKSNSNCTHKA